MAVLFLMNPMVGFVALFGAAVLFSLTIINDRLSRGALLRGQMAINPAYRRAGTAARNAHVVEAMGMMTTIVQSWHARSEERRVGKECFRTCRSWRSLYHSKIPYLQAQSITSTKKQYIS